MSRPQGALQERIVIQSATETIGTDGGGTDTWGALATVSAEFLPQSVVERLFPTSALGAESDIWFRVRRRLDVNELMRVSWTPRWPPGATAKTLEIRGVLPIDDGATWMHIRCSEL